MHHSLWHAHPRSLPLATIFFSLLLLAGCGGSGGTTPATNGTPSTNQVLTFPNVGISDIATLDPALGPDANASIAVNMIYSGLVRSDKNLNVIPDQANWQVSSDNKVYTFTLKQGITFSDGTPVTAQSYVYTWSRALLPAVASPIASFYESPIVGSDEVAAGKTTTFSGVKAIDDHTLQVTLKQPTAYFLEELTNSLFFPLNKKVIDQYGQKNWPRNAAGNAVGTGPFVVKAWLTNTKMVFTPNPNYYGNKTRLKEVDMIFVADLSIAFKSYRANQYAFTWNLLPTDQVTMQGTPGFIRMPLLQTDLLFFDNTRPPFNNTAVRQAFAYATDRDTLAKAIFKNTVSPATTIIPPGMPGYQPNYPGLPYDTARAKSLLQSVYPDVTKVPPITFSYPSSQLSSGEVAALQDMWQKALGIQVRPNGVELNAYNDATSKRQVQFGFTQWSADFPDPYDWLALNLLSTANNNNGTWKNASFDQTVMQAEKEAGNARIALYNKAEQIAINDVGWLPLDHQNMSAIIPAKVHGVTLNGNGLYFGDWSDAYLLQ